MMGKEWVKEVITDDKINTQSGGMYITGLDKYTNNNEQIQIVFLREKKD